MATKEAQSQLALLPERVSVLETKVENIGEKLIELKADVKEMHDCLDNTRDMLADKLEKMQEEYRASAGKFFEHADKLHAEDQQSHTALDGKIKDLEQFKTKWIYLSAGALASLGWVSGHSAALFELFK
jgi:hypothetical protein